MREWRPRRVGHVACLEQRPARVRLRRARPGWNLHAEEYHGRGLDWYHFDAETPRRLGRRTAGEPAGRARAPPFAGMPHPRWWRFEESSAFLEDATDPEPNLLSTLIPEFLYIDANNWFTIPLEERSDRSGGSTR